MSKANLALISFSLRGESLPFAMPTGVALMITSKASFLRSARLMVRARAWRASFRAGAALRFRMKTSLPRSFRPKTAARAAPPAPSTRTRAPSSDTLLERTYDARRVRIEAVKLAVLRPHHGVAGADLGGVRIGIVEVFEDGFLVRHGDAKAVDRNVAHARQQVLQGLGVKGEVDRVDVLAP